MLTTLFLTGTGVNSMWVIKVLILAFCFLSASYSYAKSHTGKISYYSEGSLTASGERFNKRALTCAHRMLPFGTNVQVEYRGKVVTCRVNDRGPYIAGRILDVSLEAAKALQMVDAGVITTTIVW